MEKYRRLRGQLHVVEGVGPDKHSQRAERTGPGRKTTLVETGGPGGQLQEVDGVGLRVQVEIQISGELNSRGQDEVDSVGDLKNCVHMISLLTGN